MVIFAYNNIINRRHLINILVIFSTKNYFNVTKEELVHYDCHSIIRIYCFKKRALYKMYKMYRIKGGFKF